MTKRVKKVIIVLSIVAGVCLLGAILFGVLNATVGDGQWSLGWNDYRYDDDGYEVGSGSIPVTTISAIEIDWVDGAVEIVSCQDTYPSITEKAADGSALPASAELRWKVDENGELSVKYRKSSWFFGFGKRDRNKTLILRIPEAMLTEIRELEVNAVSANVTVNGITFDQMELETRGGDVILILPEDTAFALEWSTKGGHMSTDFAMTEQNGIYTAGGDGVRIFVETVTGDLDLKKRSVASNNMP